jgi:hypothetical protein
VIIDVITESITGEIIDGPIEKITGVMFGVIHWQESWDGRTTLNKTFEPLFAAQITNVITARITVQLSGLPQAIFAHAEAMTAIRLLRSMTR